MRVALPDWLAHLDLRDALLLLLSPLFIGVVLLEWWREGASARRAGRGSAEEAAA